MGPDSTEGRGRGAEERPWTVKNKTVMVRIPREVGTTSVSKNM